MAQVGEKDPDLADGQQSCLRPLFRRLRLAPIWAAHGAQHHRIAGLAFFCGSSG